MSKKSLLILEIGETLHEEQSVGGQMCPSCHGGSTGEASMSVTRRGGLILYLCHRASCSASGAVPINGKPRADLPPRKHRVFITNPSHCPAEMLELIQTKYFLSDEEMNRAEFGWTQHYSPAGKGRVWSPVFNFLGKVRGYNCRDFLKEQDPKDLLFIFNDDDTKLAWYKHSMAKPLILVEDKISALRLSSFVNAVSLNGTHISMAMADELIRSSLGPVYLALDKDATRQAIKQAVNLRPYIKIYVAPLEKDVKDMTREELSDWLGGLS